MFGNPNKVAYTGMSDRFMQVTQLLDNTHSVKVLDSVWDFYLCITLNFKSKSNKQEC